MTDDSCLKLKGKLPENSYYNITMTSLPTIFKDNCEINKLKIAMKITKTKKTKREIIGKSLK